MTYAAGSSVILTWTGSDAGAVSAEIVGTVVVGRHRCPCPASVARTRSTIVRGRYRVFFVVVNGPRRPLNAAVALRRRVCPSLGTRQPQLTETLNRREARCDVVPTG